MVDESGSGKPATSLALLRLFLTAQVTGNIYLDGKDLLALPEEFQSMH